MKNTVTTYKAPEGVKTLDTMPLKNQALKKHLQAIEVEGYKAQKSAWKIARHAYAILNGELWKDDFETEANLAEFMGVKPSQFSTWKRAVSYANKHADAETLGYSMRRASEYERIEEKGKLQDFQKFCTVNKMDISTDGALIKAISAWKGAGCGTALLETKEKEEAMEAEYTEKEVKEEKPKKADATAKNTELAGGKKFVTIMYNDEITSVPRKEFLEFLKKYQG